MSIKYRWKCEDTKCWFGVRFVIFLLEIHLTNGMTPKTLEKCGEEVNITIGFNVDSVIFKMGIIIVASQSVLAYFYCKILCAKPEKHKIDIYWWEGYQSIDMSICGQISISVISVVSICIIIHHRHALKVCPVSGPYQLYAIMDTNLV